MEQMKLKLILATVAMTVRDKQWLHKSMTVNVITEPPATYLRRGNDVFDISGRSLAGQFGLCNIP